MLATLLEVDVEGYLFHDLDEMLRDDLHIAYPLLMATCAGIELIGKLVAQDTHPNRGSEKCFLDYWANYLYAGDKNKGYLGELIYNLVRHGLAHTFLVKPYIAVARHDIQDMHLCWGETENGDRRLFIDAAQLADDFKDSYRSHFHERATATTGTVNRNTMEARANALVKRYRNEAEFYKYKGPPSGVARIAETRAVSTTATAAVAIYGQIEKK